MATKGLRRIGGLVAALAALYYASAVVSVYRALTARRRKVLGFRGVPLERELSRHISDEEFEGCLGSLEGKVPRGEVGLLSLGSERVRMIARESAAFLGGGCAALLQLAHPFVAKGVFDHSKVLQDPLLRFQRTFHYVFRITFGDLPTLTKAARSVRLLHSKINGSLGTVAGEYKAGQPYTAHDHDAVKWVFATLLETQMFAFDLVLRPLTKAEKDEYLQYSSEGIVAYGVTPDCFPQETDRFERYYFSACHSDMLVVTKEGQAICDAIMQPILWEKFLPVPNTLKTVTGVLLPEPVAKQFGFDVGFGAYLYSAMVIALFRSVYRCLPGSVRYLTAYQEAIARETGEGLKPESQWAASFASAFVDAALRKK